MDTPTCDLCDQPIEPGQFNMDGLHQDCITRYTQLEKEKENAKKAKSGAIWIPERYITGYMALTPKQKDVVAILSSHRNERTGLAGPGLELLKSRTGHSESTVCRILKELQGIKVIRYHAGGNKGLNTQWHMFGPGKDGPCPLQYCGRRKHTGGRKPKPKVVTLDDNLSTG